MDLGYLHKTINKKIRTQIFMWFIILIRIRIRSTMNLKMYVFHQVFLLLLINFGTAAQLCTNTENLACQCKTRDGLIDLTSIGLKDGIQFQTYSPAVYSDDFLYSYNPCHVFNYKNCLNSAVCQIGRSYSPWSDIDLETTYNTGTQSSARWAKCEDNPSNNCITYTAMQDLLVRTTTVVLTCGNTTKPTLIVDGEKDLNHYVLRMTSKCACINGCTSGVDSDNDGVGSENDGFGSNNDGFGSNNDGVDSDNDDFGSGNYGFSSDDDGVGSDNYGSSSDNHSVGSDNDYFDSDDEDSDPSIILILCILIPVQLL